MILQIVLEGVMHNFRYFGRLRGPGPASGSVTGRPTGALLSKYRSFAFLGRGPLAPDPRFADLRPTLRANCA
jgi:hypothetical protein